MRKIMACCIVVVLVAALCYRFLPLAPVYSQYTSRGEEVVQIQTKLQQLGYYKGRIDGIFGLETERAVLAFQKAMGLRIDGKAGRETLQALGIQNQIPSADLRLLACAVHAEARGEPYQGQVAVAAVILNRVQSPSFPNSIAGVIYQPGAFSSVSDGQINLEPSTMSTHAAQDALHGVDPTYGSIYFYNPAKTSNRWIQSRPVIVQIGDHLFAK